VRFLTPFSPTPDGCPKTKNNASSTPPSALRPLLFGVKGLPYRAEKPRKGVGLRNTNPTRPGEEFRFVVETPPRHNSRERG